MIRLRPSGGFVCFSASANFVGSAVLGAIGVATISEVKHRRELPFGTMPLLFALRQFHEFTSLWCAYAAVVSVIIYFFFRRSRADRPANYVLSVLHGH
jgi:hypothetical protein